MEREDFPNCSPAGPVGLSFGSQLSKPCTSWSIPWWSLTQLAVPLSLWTLVQGGQFSSALGLPLLQMEPPHKVSSFSWHNIGNSWRLVLKNRSERNQRRRHCLDLKRSHPKEYRWAEHIPPMVNEDLISLQKQSLHRICHPAVHQGLVSDALTPQNLQPLCVYAIRLPRPGRAEEKPQSFQREDARTLFIKVGVPFQRRNLNQMCSMLSSVF